MKVVNLKWLSQKVSLIPAENHETNPTKGLAHLSYLCLIMPPKNLAFKVSLVTMIIKYADLQTVNPFPNDKFYSSNLKEFAYNNFEFDENGRKPTELLENTV